MGNVRGESMKRTVIFCDFDGTITKKDNIVSIMKRFAPPQWEQLKDDVLSEKMSIREGVGKMFSLLPTYETYALIEYALSMAEIREGFEQFVEYTKGEQISLYIVSGGMDFFVKPILKHFVSEESIFCNEADFSNDYISINWPHPCDNQCSNDCGCCKPSILRKLTTKEDEIIVIGDSITDLQVAKQASFVYARDLLLQKCKELNIPHEPFESFHDIVSHLRKSKVVNV